MIGAHLHVLDIYLVKVRIIMLAVAFVVQVPLIQNWRRLVLLRLLLEWVQIKLAVASVTLLLCLHMLERHLAAILLSDPLNARQIVTRVVLKDVGFVLVPAFNPFSEVFRDDAVLVLEPFDRGCGRGYRSVRRWRVGQEGGGISSSSILGRRDSITGMFTAVDSHSLTNRSL